MKTSENINEISAALSKAQGKMSHAAKDQDNPFFKSKYADLASIIEACRDALAENGLAVVQGPIKTDGSWSLVSKLVHSSGQWFETETPILSSKQDAQGFGSGMTYARRYSLAALVGVTQSDDDANEAVKPGTVIKSPAKPSNSPVAAQQPQKPPQAPPGPLGTALSEPQLKRLYAIAGRAKISEEILRNTIWTRFGCVPKAMRKMDYDQIISEMEKAFAPQATTGGSSK